MRNSLPTAALIREILYSHSLPRREILVNLSQKIAKLQANAGESNGRFQANTWPFSAAQNRTFLLILLDLTKHPTSDAKNADPSTRALAPSFPVFLFPRSLGPLVPALCQFG